jgi:hypothetical protein
MIRRPVYIPLYAVLILVFAAFTGPPLSVYASVLIANRNSTELVRRYQADQAALAAKAAADRAAQSEETRKLYCTLFSTQLDAFEEATSPAGQASYKAWLDLYKLARCEPPR